MKAGRENRPHIGIYGCCNIGKSTLLNFLSSADIAIVSPHSGTTTDPVRKSYEILDFAPVIFIDTAGIDDVSPVGVQRVERTLQTIAQVDLALLVFRDWGESESALVAQFEKYDLPYIAIHNIFGDAKSEQEGGFEADLSRADDPIRDRLLDLIKSSLPEKSYKTASMFAGRINAGDLVMLVCPIDSEAPAGRMILPQVQATRELLDLGAVAVTLQPEQIEGFLSKGALPTLVVSDSQVLEVVRTIIPLGAELTSFSILLASVKGDMEMYKRGLERVNSLMSGDKILISESCTHQVSCEDIGRVKIPRWLEAYCGCKLDFTFLSGLEPLPADITTYTMLIQCGGCMVTRSQLQNRIRVAAANGVAVTNYGMLIRKVSSKA